MGVKYATKINHKISFYHKIPPKIIPINPIYVEYSDVIVICHQVLVQQVVPEFCYHKLAHKRVWAVHVWRRLPVPKKIHEVNR